MLKSQQIFRSKKHSVFAEEVNKLALSANDDNAKFYNVKMKKLNLTI